MSEEKEFLIIRIIVTTITSIIAIMLFALLNVVIANADTMPIDWVVLTGGTSAECSGKYDNVLVNCNGNYRTLKVQYYVANHILTANTTNTIIIEGQVWGVTTTGIPSIARSMQVWNGNNWITATPDRNESFTIRPIEGNYTRFQAVWSFELDSTITTDYMLVQFDMSGGSFSTLRNFTMDIIYPYASDTDKIIASQENQTNDLMQNNNNNTDRIINWGENFQHNWQSNFDEKFNSGGNFEDSIQGNYANDLDTLNAKEGALTNKYKNNGFIYNFFINQQANTMIWNLIDRLINLSTKIYAFIISVLSLGIIAQILRRNKI